MGTALTTMVATGWSLLRHEHTPAKPQDWVRFVHAPDWKTTKVGRLEEDNVIEYAGADIFTPLEPTGRSFPVAQVKLLTPFEVRSIVALWNNFHERAKKENQSIPNFPLIFMKPTSSVIGPEQIIERPLGKNHDDGEPTRVIYEAELGVVIGKECKNVSEQDAADYVHGYTCVNDVTAPRILFEFKSKVPFQQWTRSKGYDTFTPVGPAVTTGVQSLRTMRVRAVLDGEVMQDYPVADMVFSPMKVVSMLSQVQTLMPGDLISLGTSVGAGPMNSGQRIDIEISGLPTLSNTFMDHPKAKL